MYRSLEGICVGDIVQTRKFREWKALCNIPDFFRVYADTTAKVSRIDLFGYDRITHKPLGNFTLVPFSPTGEEPEPEIAAISLYVFQSKDFIVKKRSSIHVKGFDVLFTSADVSYDQCAGIRLECAP